jgi:RhtB (resistance to homoserine/threonine) family protein
MSNPVLAFAVFAAILTVTPGLDTMLVLRTTAVAGRPAGLAAVAGIALGCFVWAAASAVGITAILAASRLAFDVLRFAGVAYLVYLGARALWHARKPVVEEQDQALARTRPRRAFTTGLTTNLLNPKVGVFYLSVMPQFLPTGVNPLLGSLGLGAIHVVEGFIWLSIVVLAVNRARRLLTRPTVRRRLEQLTGVAFLAFGLRLALERR